MEIVQKSVFISYRRANFPWALAVRQYLTQHGFDVFIDYQSIGSGDFERVIEENIRARAHFLLVLTPSALERCSDPGDLLRREIETAMASKRNIISLMIEGFDFSSSVITNNLTGTIEPLKKYNALKVYNEYFSEAMERLRTQFLNVPLSAVIHPASAPAREAAVEQSVVAESAPPVQPDKLTAQQYFERAFASSDLDERIRLYTEVIRLDPKFANAYNNRGDSRNRRGDSAGALADYEEALRLNPNYAAAYYNRGSLRDDQGDVEGALKDYEEALRLKPDFANAYANRGLIRRSKGDLKGALEDYDEALRLQPDLITAYYNRASVHRSSGRDREAAADLRQYLKLGGGTRDGDTAEVEARISELDKSEGK